jgi:DNA-binding helix-hairpin-helix protein with protein kinase domain
MTGTYESLWILEFVDFLGKVYLAPPPPGYAQVEQFLHG